MLWSRKTKCNCTNYVPDGYWSDEFLKRASELTKCYNIIPFYREISAINHFERTKLETKPSSKMIAIETGVNRLFWSWIRYIYDWIGTCNCQIFIHPVHKILNKGARVTEPRRRLWSKQSDSILFDASNYQRHQYQWTCFWKPLLTNGTSNMAD